MPDCIQDSREGNVAVLTLNAADRLNAMDLAMASALIEALNKAEAAGCRAIMLTGAGRAFCAGAAIERLDPAARGYDAGAPLETHYNPLIRAMRGLSIPILSAVQGVAAGIGCSIALGSDYILASENARFIQPFARIGLVPDTGIASILVHALGRARAMELFLLGEALGAREALQSGLVNRVVPPSALMPSAMDVAHRLAEGPSLAMALTREQVDLALAKPLDEMLDIEREQQAIAGRHPDHAEGLAAFREKRTPVFKQEH